jgi:HAE1 family hydrophobic/amphiphilic exporter-1
MKLVDSAIRYPVSVTVAVLLIVLFGLLSLFRIPVQLIPDVETPQVTVTTVWPGASPEEIETEIVQEQEEQLKTLEGLSEMTSESMESTGRVILRFQTGTDLDSSMLLVNNKLQQVPSYPQNALKPVITTRDAAEDAMAWMVLSPTEGTDLDIGLQRDFAVDVIKPALERVPGVASANVLGGRERELHVIIDPQALAGRGLTLAQVGRALDAENRDVSAGDFDEGKRRYLVRSIAEYRSVEDVENVVLAWRDGAPVYVKDVAIVELGYQKARDTVRQRGQPTLAINAVRQTGTNTLFVTQGLNQAIADLNAGPLAERGMVLEIAFIESDYIEDAISLVTRNIFVGGLLAIATLLLFLRSISSTTVIAMAIPVSVIGTFLAMTLLGRNINVVSLAGLAFAVGIIVDASIVVLENIYRHMQMGKSRRLAAYDGTTEVWGAVLASVLTTVAVFLPVLFVQEEAGQLFRDIAVAVSAAVLISLVVSITLIPSLSARILSAVARARDKDEEEGEEAEEKSWRNLWGHVHTAHYFARDYGNFIYRLTGSVKWRVILVVGLTLGAVLITWTLIPPTEYLPTGNVNFAFGIILPPPGYNVGEFTSIAERIDAQLRPYWEAEPFTPEAEQLDAPPIDNYFFVAFGNMTFMGASVDRRLADDAHLMVPALQRAVSQIPGAIGVVQQPSIFQRGEDAGRAIDIDIAGPELEELIQLGGRIFMGAMTAVPGAQARPIPSLDLGNPEVRVVVDRERAAELGMSAQDVGYALNALVDGVKVSEYQFRGEAIDLVLLGASRFAEHSQDIGNLIIATPIGRAVSIGDVGRVIPTSGPQQINHIERQRAITIQVIPPQEIPLETAMANLDQQVLQPMRQDGSLGGEYEARLAGTADKLTAARRALQGNFLLALLVTYLLMAALFESFVYPLVILFSVPFATVGGFIGLAAVNTFITYQALDVVAMLGFVILIGIVVNNAILIVHQTLNYVRDKSMAYREALREAVIDRIRPIFMSTTTSIMGMSPLILFQGAGSEIYRGLGSVVVGGLLVSTFFTLLLVPSVFSLVMDLQAVLLKAWQRRTASATASAEA